MLRKNVDKNIKIGHAGTLDPLAEGVLVICIGKATKKIESIQALPKTYEGCFFVGATTPSFDLESEVDANFSTIHIHEELLKQAAKSFEGDSLQTPPIFSAVKVDGKRAYDLARAGKKFEIKSKLITIHRFNITYVNIPEVGFEIECSKGTYIRSIARDFGKKLNSGAYLKSLRRTAVGNYTLQNCISIEQFYELILNKDVLVLENFKI